MKRQIFFATKYFIVLAILAFSSQAAAQDVAITDTLLTPSQWVEFNQNIAVAIQSDNAGVREGALRMVIRYGLYLHMDRDAAFDIVRIYRNNEDAAVRRMAVIALGNMEDRWAIEFLDMLSRFEESDTIRKTMEDSVAAYWQSHGGNPYE